MKLFANILQTKQRKEITKPLKARAVAAYFEQIIESKVLAHNGEPSGGFEEGFADAITETRTQLHPSALRLSHLEDPVRRYLGPVFCKGSAQAPAKGDA